MNKTIVAIVIAIIAILAVVFGFKNYGVSDEKGDIISIQGRDFLLSEHDDIRIAFRYPIENPEYIILEADDELSEKTLVLMRKTDYDDFIESGDIPREGPPVITISAFTRDGSESALGWAERNDMVSNYGLRQGLLEDVEIGGETGIGYATDGLYAGRTSVVVSGPFAYLFTVGYLSFDDGFLTDFEDVLKTVSFQENSAL